MSDGAAFYGLVRDMVVFRCLIIITIITVEQWKRLFCTSERIKIQREGKTHAN